MSTKGNKTIAKKTTGKTAVVSTKKAAPKKAVATVSKKKAADVVPAPQVVQTYHELLTADVIKALAELKKDHDNWYRNALHIIDKALIHGRLAGLHLIGSKYPKENSGDWNTVGRTRVVHFRDTMTDTYEFIENATFGADGSIVCKDGSEECMCDMWDSLGYNLDFMRDVFRVSMFMVNLSEGKSTPSYDILASAKTLQCIERLYEAFKKSEDARDYKIASDKIAVLNAKFPSLNLPFMWRGNFAITTVDGETHTVEVKLFSDCGASLACDPNKTTRKFIDIVDIAIIKLIPKA